MSIFGKAGEFATRLLLKRKAGKVLKVLDGYKRVIVLGLFILVAWLKASGTGDYSGSLGFVLRVLDWSPEASPVPASVVALTVGGLYAIYDGIKKALAEKKAKQDSIDSIRRFM